MIIYVVIAVLAGAMLPLQAVFNARLGYALGSPLWAAAVSALVSALVLFILGAITTGTFPRTSSLPSLPLWTWFGGICGVMTLAGVTVSLPRLGAAAMVALVIAGQVVFSLVIDRFGLFGVPPHPITVQRAMAAVLLLAGTVLLLQE